MCGKRIMIVDDHDLFREGIAQLIDSQPDWQVVAQCPDGLEGTEVARNLRPDLILMDVSMPLLNGLDVTRLILNEFSDVKILILSVHEQTDVLFAALSAGAVGYINKAAHTEDFLRYVRQALAGKAVLSPEMVTSLVQEYRRLARRAQASAEIQVTGYDLTPREEAVLKMIAAGATNGEIARQLSISIHTVKSHVQNILRKLGVASRREAAQVAQEINP